MNLAVPGAIKAVRRTLAHMGLLNFAKRHRRKLAVAAGVGAAVYWAVGYVGSKLRELQEQLLLDRLTREDLERRFEQNQKDATFTTMALFPTVSTQVLDEYDVEETRRMLQELRHGDAQGDTASSLGSSQMGSSQMSASQMSASQMSASQTSDQLTGSQITDPGTSQALGGSFVTPPSKAELWRQIKIGSLTRAFVLVYTGALLTILTRIQLNILGRRSYAESMEQHLRETTSEAALLADEEQAGATNRQFLTFSWWILHRGWRVLAERVQSAVEVATAAIEPPNRLNFVQMEDLVGAIHREIDAQGSLANVLLPPPELEQEVLAQIPGSGPAEPDLRALLDETSTIVSSASSTDVLHKMVHNALAVLVNKLHPVFASESGDARLAMALMVVTTQARQMAAGSPLSNEYVDAMIQVPELDALSAVIYSNY